MYHHSMVVRALAAVAPVACAAATVAPADTVAERPVGAVANCAHQSSADFPRAFSSPGNLVVGPLVLVGGGRPTSAETVSAFGGNKFPLLVAAGHRVTVEVPRGTRRFASFAYVAVPQHRPLAVADGHSVVTFRSCERRRASSDASGRPVTFWAGFVLAGRPQCLAFRVWVDTEAKPRRVKLPLGRRC